MIFIDDKTGYRFQIPKLPTAQPIENGGYLIGREIRESNDSVIDSFTDVHPGDEATPTGLVLKDPYHQWKIQREWELSEATQHMLGHWHSHYEYVPEPSDIDISGWHKMAEETFDSSGRSPLLCVIVGRRETRAWVVFPDAFNNEIRELSCPSKMAIGG